LISFAFLIGGNIHLHWEIIYFPGVQLNKVAAGLFRAYFKDNFKLKYTETSCAIMVWFGAHTE